MEAEIYGKEGIPDAWLINTLRQIDYSFYEIFQIYDSLFEDKVGIFTRVFSNSYFAETAIPSS